MTASVSGSSRRTTCPVAQTSCTNGTPAASASPIPAEPDMAQDNGASRPIPSADSASAASASMAVTVSRILE